MNSSIAKREIIGKEYDRIGTVRVRSRVVQNRNSIMQRKKNRNSIEKGRIEQEEYMKQLERQEQY